MLLYWETLRRACADGYGRFEFGRSTRGSGTYRFKLQWGAREEPLYWYTIRLRGAARPSPEAAGLVARAWQRMPLALATTIGPTVRRFLIQ
jgi:hypothetical protein